MTSTQMRMAVNEIHSGISFEESSIPQCEKNEKQWKELQEEIQNGYSIDKLENIRYTYKMK
ncbi:MAG: hypothetical protein HKO89_05565 [Saprospiraceae bacterium]|nr:hypothetical protein [Bacteroidia bacterium]NNK90058.1 hypothetical protein [Saprospiraceae bacterium]